MMNRRHFVLKALPAAAALAGGLAALPSRAAAARLEENDRTAIALGYRHDAKTVDAKRYPTFAPGRYCDNCTLYTGKPGEAWGPCSAVGGRLVAAKGWCVAWVKKA